MNMLLLLPDVSPEKWVDLLRLYGPMALFVFMVFVLLAKARITSTPDPAEKRVQLVAYLLVWLSIFVLAGIIIIVYWKTNFPTEYVAIGKIKNLTYPQTISTEQELFLHRRTVAGRHFEYDWRLISSKRIDESIELILQNDPKDATVFIYKLPVTSDFYSGPVELTYDSSTKHIVVKSRTVPETSLIPVTDNVASWRPRSHGSSSVASPDIVYAGSDPQTSPEELIRALDADDPLIRRAARRDLASLGQTAVPQLSDAITNPASSYRLRIGSLAAFIDMDPKVTQLLGEAVRCAIFGASSDPDPTMQVEANQLLARGLKPTTSCTEPKSSTVHRLSLAKIESSGSHPVDLALDVDGTLLVLDSGGGVSRIAGSTGNSHSEKLFSIPRGFHPSTVTSNDSHVMVTSNSPSGCVLYLWEKKSRAVSTPFLGQQRCTGIAADGPKIYVAFPLDDMVKIWNEGNFKNPSRIFLSGARRPTTLAIDHSTHELFVADATGQLYLVSPGTLKSKKIAENVGAVAINSIGLGATDVILVGNGYVSCLDRKTYAKQHRGCLEPKLKGVFVGVRVNASQEVWLLDWESSKLIGPYRIN